VYEYPSLGVLPHYRRLNLRQPTRWRSANATQNLLIKPGGPGRSGIDMLYSRGARLENIIGDGSHLLTFDPRSVNSSTPTASCYPDADTRQSLSGLQILNPIAEASTIYAWAKKFVRACPDTMGDYAPYINAPQTVADMNSILDAVDQRDMIFCVFSYGRIRRSIPRTVKARRHRRTYKSVQMVR
jgi:pimeloyl-ACP methyl ester carboxylesterase